MISESSKGQVRQFLATVAGREWMQHSEDNCPELELGKVDPKAYEDALREEKGWRKRGKYMVACVQEEVLRPDYGVKPIDWIDKEEVPD
jgi:hypothetical protein